VERLLRARHDEDLVGGDLGAGPVQVVGHPAAQRRIAFGGAVLQGGAAVVGQNLVERRAYYLYRETARGRQAAREGDDLGSFSDLEDLADGRAGELLGALGERAHGFEGLVHGRASGERAEKSSNIVPQRHAGAARRQPAAKISWFETCLYSYISCLPPPSFPSTTNHASTPSSRHRSGPCSPEIPTEYPAPQTRPR